MNILNWLSNAFFNKGRIYLSGNCGESLSVESAYRDLAINACVNLIADTLSQCEFETYEKGKFKRGNNYYLFNVQPNKNQNATAFMHEMVSKLLLNNECLVIMEDKQLYIADSWDVDKKVLYENVYTNVTVGELTFKKPFEEHEVFHLQHNIVPIKTQLELLYTSYGKLIDSAMTYYKQSNAFRGVVEIEASMPQNPDELEKERKAMHELFKPLFNKDSTGTIVPLQKGLVLKNIAEGTDGKTSRDIRAVIDDVFNYVCIAFNVPKSIFFGDTVGVSEQVDSFLMFCIKPLAELIAAEFNRKMYTYQDFIDRNFVKINTENIKIIDIAKQAVAFDRFVASGVYSINDILRKLGRETINEEWADEHFITKNYEPARLRGKGEDVG